MVAGTAGTLPAGCGAEGWGDLQAPSGIPLSGYPIEPLAEYFVQKVHTWQAQCVTAAPEDAISVNAAWGDNLGGDAKLRAGSPIRVELVLTDSSGMFGQGLGYTVVKLEPNKLDRESAYGTLAPAIPEDMTPVVHDGLTNLQITGPDGWQASVTNPLKPEINATGKVVYGYQLIAPAPGDYVITFTMPSVTIASCDVGECSDGHTASLTITVGGGGGGKKGGQ